MSFVENNNFNKIENSRSRQEAIVSRRLHSKPPLMQSKKARVVWNEKLLLTNLSKNEWPGQDKFNSSRCIRLEKAGYRALLRDKSYMLKKGQPIQVKLRAMSKKQ